MRKVCQSCGDEFDTPYESKNYCTVRCRNRSKVRRASTRDKIVLTSKHDSRFYTSLLNPTTEQIHMFAEKLHTGNTNGKPIRLIGTLATTESGFSDITIVTQYGTDPQEWVMMKTELDVMATFK